MGETSGREIKEGLGGESRKRRRKTGLRGQQ